MNIIEKIENLPDFIFETAPEEFSRMVRLEDVRAIMEEYKKQEPFGYFKAEPFGWTDCAETDEGAIALYENPPLSDETVKDAEPLRINLGYGKYGIHNGNIDGVHCLTVSTKGTGKVGEPTFHENMTALELSEEVLSITFANIEAFNVFKKYIDAIDEAMKEDK